MSVDCALVTALPKELDKVLFHFRHSKPVEAGNGRTYYETMSPSGLTLVGATCTGMGQLNAATLVRDVTDLYNPKSIILVGIAGGLNHEIPLGDVVVSEQIVDYELGKITPKGLEVRWSVYPPDQKLVNKAQGFKDSSWKKYITTARPENIESNPSSHIGLYLSGNKVIADEKTAGALKSFWTRGSAIEMEAVGIAAMLRQMENPPSFIMIKGICDYADSNKNDKWQTYAADAASSFTYSFVIDKLTPQDFAWPHRVQSKKTDFDYRGLRVALSQAFNMSELEVLCFDLGIDSDEITGNVKSKKISELILYLKRHNKVDSLVKLVNEERDGLLTAFSSTLNA